ncbi:MAG: 1-(5-phosphoribosyl)-5-[(5-phosphoribosylamino)methylideneamino] imidazole-4-carboxamide isomerase, partial [Bacteroidota bacterium]
YNWEINKVIMQLIPSISVLDGEINRLSRGDYNAPFKYDESPIDLCRKFEDHGIEVIHLLDLDGAREGRPVNYDILETIAGHTNLRIDFSGGIHTDGGISKAFEYGAKYLTIGSAAVKSPELFASWIISFGREKITLSADSKNGKIAVLGWQKDTDIDLFEHIGYFYERGLKYVKTTDIDRDGMMEGPAFGLYEEILKHFPDIKVLASGGVRNMDDMKRLADMGVFATIFGKAYFEGKVTLKELETYTSQVNQGEESL